MTPADRIAALKEELNAALRERDELQERLDAALWVVYASRQLRAAEWVRDRIERRRIVGRRKFGDAEKQAVAERTVFRAWKTWRDALREWRRDERNGR